MGWTVMHRSLPTREARDAHLRSTFTTLTAAATEAGHANDIVASAWVGSTWYAAMTVRRPGKPAFTTALVVLTRSNRGGFGWKEMDESMGPNESRCPARILDLLSPVSALGGGDTCNGWAQAWRDRCREALVTARTQAKTRRRFKPGDSVSFAEPLRFTGGWTASRFTAVAYRGKTVWRAENGLLCRLTSKVLEQAQVEG